MTRSTAVPATTRIIGGAGNDTAVYTAAVDPSNITDDGSHFVVTAGGSEDTDTLSGIEKIGGAGTPNILLVGHGGYSSIQAAVDAAVDGDIIEIAAGTWTEDVAVHGKALTIDGVSGVNDVILNGKITVDGTLNGAFKVTDLNIDATGKDYGVFVSANSNGFGGSVTLDGVSIAHAQSNGFAYIRAGNGSSPTQGDTIGAVSILNSQFSDNAITNTGGGGRGDILLFGYNQDLTLTNVDISSPGAFAQKAIQMRGIQDGGDLANVGPYDQAGDVAINNLTITGAYGQDVIGFYRIAGFDSFTGSNNSVDVTRSANANANGTLEPWAVINMDEVGGSVDLSSFFSHASNMASANGSDPAVPSWIRPCRGSPAPTPSSVPPEPTRTSAVTAPMSSTAARAPTPCRAVPATIPTSSTTSATWSRKRSTMASTRCSRRPALRSAPMSRT